MGMNKNYRAGTDRRQQQKIPAKKKVYRERVLDKTLRSSLAQAYGDQYLIRKVSAESQFTQGGKRIGADKGAPDFAGHIWGLHVEIEDKVHPNRPHAEQIAQLDKVNRTGGIGVIVVYLPKEKTYWMIHGSTIKDFSYRDRTGWFPLPVLNTPGKTVYLDMTALTCLLQVKMNEIRSI